PRYTAGVVAILAVRRTFEEAGGRGRRRGGGLDDEVGQETRGRAEARLNGADQLVDRIDRLTPGRVFGRGSERAEMVQHEIGRARRVDLRISGSGPVTEQRLVRRLVHVASLDVGDDGLRFLEIAGAGPLLVGEQERKGDVEVSIRGRVLLRSADRAAAGD